MKNKMAHAKQRANSLPARHLGQSRTSSRGTYYVYFEEVGRLFRVDPNNSLESTEFTGSHEAMLIKACKVWTLGVSRWAYKQLRSSKLRKLGSEIAVEGEVKILSTVPLLPNPSSDEVCAAGVKSIMSEDEFAHLQTFTRQCGVIKVVLVLKEDGSPRNADVFHLSDGKAFRCRTGSKGQQQTVEQLRKNNWKEGNLGQPQFVSILDLLKTEAVENTSKQKAA